MSHQVNENPLSDVYVCWQKTSELFFALWRRHRYCYFCCCSTLRFTTDDVTASKKE